MVPLHLQVASPAEQPVLRSPASVPRAAYRPEIDGLRALAVIAVIANHFNSALLPGGFLGVDVFFVISGFVVTSSLRGKPAQSWRSYLLSFYARRVKRLIPALLFCVIITSLVGCLFIDVDLTRDSLRTGISSLFGVSNLYILKQRTDYFGQSAKLNLFTQTWSLGVEEQFYLLFPILLGLCGYSARKRPRGSRNLFWAVLSLSTASIIGYLYLSAVRPDAAFFLMPARFWELGAGCLVFLLPNRGASSEGASSGSTSPGPAPVAARFNRIKAIATPVSLLMIIAALYLGDRFQTISTVAITLFTCVLLWAFSYKGALFKVFSARWMVKIGLLSYSLYLWHWSVLVISSWTIGISKWTVPVQLLAILGCAIASSVWIEKPMRYANWSASKLKTIGYSLMATLSTAGVLFALDKPLRGKLYTGKWYPDTHVSTFKMEAQYEPCKDATEASDTLAECFYPQRATSQASAAAHTLALKTVYFVGDSHTGSLQALASRMVEKRNVPRIMMLEKEGCLFSASLLRVDSEGHQCLDSNQTFLSKVLETGNPGDVVVMTIRHKLYFLSPNSPDDILKLEKGMFAFSHNNEILSKSQALNKYLQDLAYISQELAKENISLVVQAPLPDWKHRPSQCDSQWFRPSFNLPKDCELSVLTESQQREPLMDRFRQLESALPNLHIYDPFFAFCNLERCQPFSKQGVPLFRDADHLNNYGAEHIYDDFIQYLKSEALIDNN